MLTFSINLTLNTFGSNKNLNNIKSKNKTQQLIPDFKDNATFNAEFFKIMAMGLFGAISYGIIQDQITALVCIEYFNSDAVPNHKALLDNPAIEKFFSKINPNFKNSPTLIAFLWGTYVTWWMELPLGTTLAFCAIAGSWPKLKAKDLIKPTAITFSTIAGISLLSGILGYFFIKPIGDLRQHLDLTLPQNKISAYMANACAHQAAYIMGTIKGVNRFNFVDTV